MCLATNIAWKVRKLELIKQKHEIQISLYPFYVPLLHNVASRQQTFLSSYSEQKYLYDTERKKMTLTIH